MKKTIDNVVHSTNDAQYQLIVIKRQFQQQINSLEKRLSLLEDQQSNGTIITNRSH